MILAIDAGFAHTGLAWVSSSGKVSAMNVIDTEKSDSKRKLRVCDDLSRRSSEMFRQLKIMMDNPDVDGVVVEMPSGGGKSAVAVRAMAMALAIVSCAVEASGKPAEWVSPAEGKKAACGKLNASKDEMQAAMIKKFGIKLAAGRTGKPPGWFEHVADALAAYCAVEHGTLVKLCQAQEKARLAAQKAPPADPKQE